jgi:3-hydroxyisobutyrate dehydrogenase-like beta-hydroxyacid dehydrogenase
MGASIGALLVEGGHEVLWLPRGRSEASARRAAAAGLTRGDTLEDAEVILSGDRAPEAARLFEDTRLEPVVLDDSPVAASALKMAYAAWTKGSAALLLSALASARATGVEEALRAEWRRSQPKLEDRWQAASDSATAKGWRWVGEMEEIAATYAAAGLPSGFHEAAAEIFDRATRSDP